MAGDETPEQEAIEEEAAAIDPRDDDAPEQIRELEEEAARPAWRRTPSEPRRLDRCHDAAGRAANLLTGAAMMG